MTLEQTFLALIDMRSFSELWYWLALAGVWSRRSYYVIGIPFDMVRRAGLGGGSAARDLEDLARIRAGRLAALAEATGPALVAGGALVFTTLALLGFAYRVEFAQALFLLSFPLGLAALMGMRVARRIARERLSGAGLRRTLSRHRRAVQSLGVAAIFVTALWGMYANLVAGPFGI